MARLAAGDRTELDSVHRTLDGPVRAFCSKMLGSGADADDAAQEAMVELFGKISTFDAKRDALAWALTIAAWECRTIRKSRARRRTSPADLDAMRGGTRDPEAELGERELANALEAAFESLSDGDRGVLDQVLSELRGDAAFRKRKERMLDRVRAFVRRTYDLDV